MRETFNRWIDILVLHIIAFAFIILIFSIFYKNLIQYSKWMMQQPAFFRLLAIFLISSCLWFFIDSVGGIRFNDLSLRKYFRYPAIWVTSIFFALFLFGVDVLYSLNDFSLQQTQISISNTLTFFIAGTFVSLYRPKMKSGFDDTYRRRNNIIYTQDIFNTSESVIEWAQSEMPITSIHEDMFNYHFLANKINGIINGEKNKNIGIIGAFGSGKSSVLNLIISEKRTNEIFCKIEGWGFREKSAVEHILHLIIEDLKKHFDCLSISNIPKQYSDVMNSSGSKFLEIMHCLTRGTRNPELLLKKIDVILRCNKQKLVIILEDIDRNINDETFYNEIASFLNITKELNYISFIIAVGPKNDLGNILTKLCEHNEYIQRVDKKLVSDIIGDTIESLCKKYDYIKIRSEEEIKKSLSIPISNDEETRLLHYGFSGPLDYIKQLLDTPRKVKAAIREIDTIWYKLHGEIDFRTLLLTTVLKVSAPEAYSFINENIVSLRNIHTSREKDEQKVTQLLDLWNKKTDNISWDVESARQIICVLFPQFRSKSQDRMIGTLISEQTQQGLIDNSRTDYWVRLNIGMLQDDELSDQKVLRAINNWKMRSNNSDYSNDSEIVENLLSIHGYADKIEQFGTIFDASDILLLASILFETACLKFRNLTSGDICPGFINFWRLIHKKNVPDSEYNNWLLMEIEKSLHFSLHFTHDLYYYWRHKTDYGVNSKERTPELRKDYIELVKKNVDNKPRHLIKILDQSNPWGFCHIVFLDKENENEDWLWLGTTLLNAAKSNERLISSYIACLIIRSELKHSADPDIDNYWDCRIDYSTLEEIFGSKIQPVMELLSLDFEYPELDDDYNHSQGRAVIVSANEEAKRWLKDNRKTHKLNCRMYNFFSHRKKLVFSHFSADLKFPLWYNRISRRGIPRHMRFHRLHAL